MGFTTALERRASPENPSTSLSRPAEWLYDAFGATATPAGPRVNEQSAMKFTAVYACVRVLAETVASVPLPVYQRGPPRERATDHPIYRLLHDRPNGELSSFNFREILQAHLTLWGNAYCEIERNGTGQIVGLWPLTPNRVEVERVGGMKRYTVTLETGAPVILPAANVLHIPGLGFNGLVGFSPIHMAKRAIGLGLAAEEFGSRLFGQGMTLRGVLQHPGTLTDPAQKRLRRSMDDTYSGLSNAHRTMILEEGMTYEKIGIPPEDAQFIQSRKFQAVEVARIYRVPPHMIGDVDKPFQSNVEQMGLQFLTFTMNPWFTRWEGVLNWDLFGEEERGEYYAEFLVEGLLRGDSQSRSELYRSLFGIGSISPNEIADRENLPRVEGGDERFVPLNMVPLSQARQVAEDDMREQPAPRTTATLFRERRALRVRRRIRSAYEPLIRAAAERIVRREASSGRAAVKRAFGERDEADFRRWMRDFYESHGEYVSDQMRPVIETYAEAMWEESVEEAGGDDTEVGAAGAEFITAYLGVFVQRYIGSSEGQLNGLLEATPPDELAETLSGRFDEWQEKRPDKVASNEAVRFGEAIAIAAWKAMGVTKLQWRAAGSETCPLCQELDGRVVGIDRPFVANGETVPGDDETPDLTTHHDTYHAPLHGGCVCSVVPA